MWEGLVELVRVGIVATAQICGGSIGSAVVLVSIGVRVALFPLTLRIARHARVQQQLVATLKPTLEALQKRYAKDPAKMLAETQALYRKHNIRFITPSGILGLVVQAPLLGALFSATRRGLGAKVRFLWIAELTRPDAVLGLGVSALTAIVMAAAAASGADKSAAGGVGAIMAAAFGIVTLVFLWSASSAVALSVGGGALASGLQTWILARDRPGVETTPRPEPS